MKDDSRITKKPTMMRPLFDIGPLREDLGNGALILTPNNRLASKIRQAWGFSQHSCTLHWSAPEVYALEQWVHEQWLRCCDAGFIEAAAGSGLSTAMELFLWEQVVAEDRERPATVLPANFSRLASNSYANIQNYLVPDTRLQQEAPLLWRWISHFREKLRQHSLITSADKVKILQRAYSCGILPAIPTVTLCGFDNLTPLHRKLLEGISNNLAFSETEPVQSQPQQVALYDEQAELTAAADWAVAHYLAAPEARIGILVPELPKLRNKIARLLRTRLQPGYGAPGQLRASAPFNLSAGIPLAETPLIASALLLLTLNRAELPLTDFCRMLNAPFWSGLSPEPRAKAELLLRKQGRVSLRSSEFRHLVSEVEKITGSAMSQQLSQMDVLRRALPATAGFSAWLTLFQQQLTTLGWPGERTLDSEEYQQRQHWLDMLEQYQSLDQLNCKVNLNEALQQLQQLAYGTIFQAETPDSSIQVLGFLEGAGLHFDHLWIMGLDNRRWPQPTALNPLLPVGLQREFGMPRTDPGRERELAERQLVNLMKAAPKVILSYSQFDGDQQLQPTNLIAGVAKIEPDKLPRKTGQVTDFVTLEPVSCEFAPPLDTAKEAVRGGTRILKNQASCPFNAFAIHRLGAEQPREPSIGLNAGDRGSLIHECLRQLWQHLENQQQLLALSEPELASLIESTVNTVLKPWQMRRADLFGKAFTRIEQQRLAGLLKQWLTVEKQRPPFSVAALEKHENTQFCGLPLHLVIDRIDQLADGQTVIIDYKTGKAATGQWLGDRPDDLQLPLYLLCSETPASAICFALINPSEPLFTGYSETDGLLAGVAPPKGKKNEPESWQALMDHWQQAAATLTGEFKAGYAAVSFHGDYALRYQTELEPLNRVAERQQLFADEDEV